MVNFRDVLNSEFGKNDATASMPQKNTPTYRDTLNTEFAPEGGVKVKPGTVTTQKPDWAQPDYVPPLPSNLSPAYQQGQKYGANAPEALKPGLAFATGAADTASLGWAPWAEAAAVKGLSNIVSPEMHEKSLAWWENRNIDPNNVEAIRAKQKQIQDMPMKDIAEMARGQTQQFQVDNPKTTTAGKVAGVVGGALTLPAILPRAGAIISGGLTAGTYGGLEGFSKNLDPIDAFHEAIFAAPLGATFAPVAERLVGGVSNLFKSGENIFNESGGFSDKFIKVARQAGMNDDEMKFLLPYLRDSFDKRGMTPEAARMARFERFGVEPTQGMVTKDPAQIAMETRAPAAGMPAAATPSYERIAEQSGKAAEAATGNAPMADVRGSVGQAYGRVQSEAEAAEKAYQDAYKAAGDQPGGFKRDYLTNVGDQIERKINADPDKSGITSLPVVRNALGELNDAIGSFKPTIDEVTGAPLQVMHRCFQTVERARQNLNVAYGNATPAEKSAIREVINHFDDHFENAINEGAFSGDPAVIDQWKTARAAYKDYQDRFGVTKTGDDAGSLVKTIVDGTKSPEDVARLMFNFANGDAAMTATAGKTIRQIARAIGPDAPEIQQIRESFIRQLMTPNGGTQKDFATAATRMSDFLDGKGGGVAAELFHPRDLNMIRSFSNMMRDAAGKQGSMSPKKIGMIKYILKNLPNAIAEKLNLLVNIHFPGVAAAVGAAKLPFELASQYSQTPGVIASKANAPMTFAAPSWQRPSIRTAVPLASPMVEDEINKRQGHASGGRAGKDPKAKAMALIALADRIKKEQGNETKPLLNLDDTTVAKALAIANRGI